MGAEVIVPRRVPDGDRKTPGRKPNPVFGARYVVRPVREGPVFAYLVFDTVRGVPVSDLTDGMTAWEQASEANFLLQWSRRGRSKMM